MPYQVAESPVAGHFALPMQRLNGGAIRLALSPQHLILRHNARRQFRHVQPEFLAPILLLGTDDMADDPVSIAPSAARAASHLKRHARTDVVKESPARQHELPLTSEFL